MKRQTTNPQYRTGRVRVYIRAQSHGFIAPDSGADDVFFEQGSFVAYAEAARLVGGERVRFRTTMRRGRPFAFAVEFIDRPQQAPKRVLEGASTSQ